MDLTVLSWAMTQNVELEQEQAFLYAYCQNYLIIRIAMLSSILTYLGVVFVWYIDDGIDVACISSSSATFTAIVGILALKILVAGLLGMNSHTFHGTVSRREFTSIFGFVAMFNLDVWDLYFCTRYYTLPDSCTNEYLIWYPTMTFAVSAITAATVLYLALLKCMSWIGRWAQGGSEVVEEVSEAAEICERRVTLSMQTKILDQVTCPICFGEYKKRQRISTLPCSHKFHSKCLAPWILKNTSCPMCRAEIIMTV